MTTNLNPRKLVYGVTKWSQWVISQWVCSVKSRPSVHLGLFLLRVSSFLLDFFLMELEYWCVFVLFLMFFLLNSYSGKLICICCKGIQQYFLSFQVQLRKSKGLINSSYIALVWTQSASTNEERTLTSHF